MVTNAVRRGVPCRGKDVKLRVLLEKFKFSNGIFEFNRTHLIIYKEPCEGDVFRRRKTDKAADMTTYFTER